MNFYWTLGHVGVELNEKEDKDARKAAEKEENGYVLPYSLDHARQHIKGRFNNKRGPVTRESYKTKGKYVANALDGLEKGQTAEIFQL